MKSFQIIVACAMVCFSAFVHAQNPALQNFKPLKSEGSIPKEVLERTGDKYKRSVAENMARKDLKSTEKKRINDFLYRDHFSIDILLRGGLVIYNDSISNYIHEIADLLLKDDPALREKLRFFVLKDNSVNAFATNPGYIFLTIGLLAQLESEDQLAFVLAHEITHCEESHGIEQVLTNYKLAKEAGRGFDYDEHIKAMSRFSRHDEMEADSAGFYRFIKAGYSPEGALSMMDVLQLSFMPFSNEPFNFGLMETQALKIPRWLVADTVTAIPFDTDTEDDSKSTHPNINSRRNTLIAFADEHAQQGKQFVISKTRFQMAVEKARFELLYLDLLEARYCNVLYNANILMQRYPNNHYLEASFAKAMYGTYKYAARNKNSSIGFDPEDQYGEIQRMSSFFNDLDDEAIGLLALGSLLNVEKKYNDEFMTALANDLMQDLYSKEKINGTTLIDKVNIAMGMVANGLNKSQEELQKLAQKKQEKEEKKDKNQEDEPQTPTETAEEKSGDKYKELRKKREQKKVLKTGEKTDSVAFVDLGEKWEDHYYYLAIASGDLTRFQERYDSLAKAQDEAEESSEAWEKNKKKNATKYRRKGYSLGIDKVAIVDPFLYKFRDGADKVIRMDVESEEFMLNAMLDQCATQANLKHSTLAWQEMNEDDVDDFAAMSTMNAWHMEKAKHVDRGVEMIPLTTDYLKEAAQSVNADYILYPGVISVVEPHRVTAAAVVVSIFFYPVLPFMLYHWMVPGKECHYYYTLYDANTGELVWNHHSYSKSRYGRDRVQSFFYDVFHQIHKSK